MIGEHLEKYLILEKIGEGGMATVYRGQHTTLKRDVAVKVLHPHLLSNPKNRQRFTREAKAIERLRHDNILRIFDYSGEDSETCFIITELIEGSNLREELAEHGPFPSEVVAMVTRRLLAGLSLAHDSGIIHRDIKPANVMISSSGAVKLMDFGVARTIDETAMTLTGALVGSPAYMSPEQATNTPVDARSDLFSVGTLMYQMVTGTTPFGGTNASTVLRAIIDSDFEPPQVRQPDMSRTLASIIMHCLESDASRRYANADTLADDLAEVLLSAGLDADDPGPAWSVHAWFSDQQDYRTRLERHLIGYLNRSAEALLEIGSPTASLECINRVLSIDDGNAEALTLLTEATRPSARLPYRQWLTVAVACLAATGALVAAVLWTGPPPPPEQIIIAPEASLRPAPATPTDSEAEIIPLAEAPTIRTSAAIEDPSDNADGAAPIRRSPRPQVAVTAESAPILTVSPIRPPRAVTEQALSQPSPAETASEEEATSLQAPAEMEDEPDTEERIPAGFGTVDIEMDDAYAVDFWFDDGEQRFNAAEPGALHPQRIASGRHTLHIAENEMVSPVETPIPFVVRPGQETDVKIEFVAHPRTVTLLGAAELPGETRIVFDGQDLGALSELLPSFSVPGLPTSGLLTLESSSGSRTITVTGSPGASVTAAVD